MTVSYMKTLSHFIRDLSIPESGDLWGIWANPPEHHRDNLTELLLFHEVLLCSLPPALEPPGPFALLRVLLSTHPVCLRS